MSKKNDVSRRQFLSRTALTLPVAAAAIPAAIEMTSPAIASAASVRQDIPNRTIPSRSISSAYTYIINDLPTDETSDCAQKIQDAINAVPAGGGTIIIPRKSTGGNYPPPNDTVSKNRCIYMLNCQKFDDGVDTSWGFKMKDQVRLQFEAGVVLQAMTINTDPNKLTKRAYMVLCQGIGNVEFVNCWLVGERQTHIYSHLTDKNTDEWIYGINIAGCTGVNVLGTYVSDQTGDGIQIGRYNNVDSSDIVVCDSICTGNRRQAISLTGCSDVSLFDSEFSYSYGTLPMNGVDIEPQGAGSVSSVTIDNCLIRGNEGNGIECNAQGTSISNITVLNSKIQDNYWNGFWAHMGGTGTISGGSIQGNAFYQNGRYGLALGGTTTGYLVGATNSDGMNSNNFANNFTSTNGIQYPNTNKTNQYGYITGSDMNTATPSANTWHYNSFFTH